MKKDWSVWQVLQHRVQRLTLLLPVGEQNKAIEVIDSVISRIPGGSHSRGRPTIPDHGSCYGQE